jgi:hypothetical protein
LGKRPEKVPGDGNCFFYALSKQLQRFSPLLHKHYPSYEQLRTAAIGYITEHSDAFAPFFPLNASKLPAHLEKMNARGEWVDEPIMVAAAKALGVSIRIIRSDGAEDNIINLTGGSEPILQMAYYVGLHYDSLVDISFASIDNDSDSDSDSAGSLSKKREHALHGGFYNDDRPLKLLKSGDKGNSRRNRKVDESEYRRCDCIDIRDLKDEKKAIRCDQQIYPPFEMLTHGDCLKSGQTRFCTRQMSNTCARK